MRVNEPCKEEAKNITLFIKHSPFPLAYEATFHCCCNKMEATSREDFVYIGGPKNISYKGAIIFCMSNTFNGNVILQCY